MKKQILNLGTVLSKAEQQNVYGGGTPITHEGDPCDIIEGQKIPQGCPCRSDDECFSGNCDRVCIF